MEDSNLYPETEDNSFIPSDKYRLLIPAIIIILILLLASLFYSLFLFDNTGCEVYDTEYEEGEEIVDVDIDDKENLYILQSNLKLFDIVI